MKTFLCSHSDWVTFDNTNDLKFIAHDFVDLYVECSVFLNLEHHQQHFVVHSSVVVPLWLMRRIFCHLFRLKHWTRNQLIIVWTIWHKFHHNSLLVIACNCLFYLSSKASKREQKKIFLFIEEFGNNIWDMFIKIIINFNQIRINQFLQDKFILYLRAQILISFEKENQQKLFNRFFVKNSFRYFIDSLSFIFPNFIIHYNSSGFISYLFSFISVISVISLVDFSKALIWFENPQYKSFDWFDCIEKSDDCCYVEQSTHCK